MEVIVSHTNLDFDGLAAMVAAAKLYPLGQMVLPDPLSRPVQEFLSLYKDSLSFRLIHDVNPGEVQRMIVVDTNNSRRLGKLGPLALSGSVEVHLYDHHPPVMRDLPATLEVVDNVGAVTTLLVEMLQKHHIKPDPFEATILALGIYQDTGGLIFTSTTARDALAVAFLLELGASLQVVGGFVERPLTGEQQMLLNRLISSAEEITVAGAQVLVALASAGEFVGGVAVLAEKLIELTAADAVLVGLQMGTRVVLVGRSREDSVPVDQVLHAFGGGGHPRAAAATVKGSSLEEIAGRLRQAINENITPVLTAHEMMSTPVKTVEPATTIHEAGLIMLRYGHSGLPVVQDGAMVGIISRRDVDKAGQHGLGHAPVKGYMTRQVISVQPDTPLSELQRLMIQHDIGRLPVFSQGKLAGIVSRSDVLRALHGTYRHRFRTMYTDQGSMEVTGKVQKLMGLPQGAWRYLRDLGSLADQLGWGIYLVGGCVRDLLLGVPSLDLDLVVEGEGVTLAEEAAALLDARLQVHQRFGTATLTMKDGIKLDIATARKEYYQYPAALPTVEASSLREDLYRRDFTINAMAIRLNRKGFGYLIDFFSGEDDLEKGLVRILYNLSFVEDPTRILRAIRFEQRYAFALERETLGFARRAVSEGLLGRVTSSRLGQELRLILQDKNVVGASKRMEELAIWERAYPLFRPGVEEWRALERIPPLLEKALGAVWAEDLRPWLVYLGILLHNIDCGEIPEIGQQYGWGKRDMLAVSGALSRKSELAAMFGEQIPRLGTIHQLLETLTPESILILIALAGDRSAEDLLWTYIERRHGLHLATRGEDLISLGLSPGPVFSEVVRALFTARLEGEVHNLSEELDFTRRWLSAKGVILNVR
ncbi:MAG: CBS domain-containing protein [Bacillota bacterium]